jgi:hypothetical protein
LKLHDIYTEILIKEVGEGTSEPFNYKEGFRSDSSFSYIIGGEVESDTGKKTQIPIRLQGVGFKTQVDYDTSTQDWEIDGNIDDIAQEKGKFFNVNPGTTLKGVEIIFALMEGGNSFAEVNDRVFMFRLMATIKKILQEEFAKEQPDFLMYSPTKQGNEAADQTGRHKLYSAFIKKAFPNAKVFVDRDNDEIIYKLK